MARNLWSGALVAGSIVMLAACDSEQTAPPAATPPTVLVAPVLFRDVAAGGRLVGRVEAYRRVEVRARVTGFLLERPFGEGLDVAAGDLLFRIDDAEYRATRDAAAAEVHRATATLDMARAELERADTLFERGNISEAVIEQRRADLARGTADLASAQASLQQAELDVGYAAITTPIAGRIGRAAIDVGNLIGPDSGVLASVLALDPIHVSFPVAERIVTEARAEGRAGPDSLTIELRLGNGTTYSISGRIDYVSAEVDPATDTVEVRALFDNPDLLLLPGQFVTVIVTSQATEHLAVVPQAAVQETQAGRFVLVVGADNRVEARPIDTGDRIGADWAITAGLEEGETIIVEGIQRARPGGLVTPQPAAPPAKD